MAEDKVLKIYLEKISSRSVTGDDTLGRELATAAQKIALIGIGGSELSEFLLKTLWGVKVRIDKVKEEEFKETLERIPDGLLKQFAQIAIAKAEKRKV